MLAEIGIGAGDAVDIALEDGRIVMAPIKQPRRACWAEASRDIAAAGDDELAWPEFGNTGDDGLVW